MPHSLPRGLAESHGNSLALSCLLRAVDESGQPRKAFAIDCDLTEQELSKAFTSQRFDLRWLDLLPPVVVLEFLTAYLKAKYGAAVDLPQPEDLLQRVLAEVHGLMSEVRQAQTLAEMRARKGAA